MNTLEEFEFGHISLLEWGVYSWLCLKADETGTVMTSARGILCQCPRERSAFAQCNARLRVWRQSAGLGAAECALEVILSRLAHLKPHSAPPACDTAKLPAVVNPASVVN